MNSPHLTADELDTLLNGNGSPVTMSHLATCRACTLMVEQDHQLVRALAALPYYDVAAGFDERVIRNLTPRNVPMPVPSAVIATPRALAARRRAIGVLVLATGSVTAVFVWASAHPGDALRWSGPAIQDAGHALWLSLQTVVANATDQPWFSSVRDTMATPGRAFLALVGMAGAYAAALMGLRRLMTEPATDAGW